MDIAAEETEEGDFHFAGGEEVVDPGGDGPDGGGSFVQDRDEGVPFGGDVAVLHDGFDHLFVDPVFVVELGFERFVHIEFGGEGVSELLEEGELVIGGQVEAVEETVYGWEGPHPTDGFAVMVRGLVQHLKEAFAVEVEERFSHACCERAIAL